MTQDEPIAQAIREGLANQDGETVADALTHIARSICSHTDAIDRLTEAIREKPSFNWERGQME